MSNTAVITNGIINQRYDKTRINVLTLQILEFMSKHTQIRHTYICLTLLLFDNQCTSNSCAHVTLTLNDVGDHEGGAGIVADETATSQVVFDLQGK